MNNRHGTGAGPDLGDDAGVYSGPDDVVATVVLAADAVEGLDVDGVGCTNGRSSSAPQATHWAMVFTSGGSGSFAGIVIRSLTNPRRHPGREVSGW